MLKKQIEWLASKSDDWAYLKERCALYGHMERIIDGKKLCCTCGKAL